MALYHLVYQSKATRPYTDEELSKLLDIARSFNAKFNITGILLYGHGYFLQMLEGDDDVVRSLYYLRIASDPNHASLRVLKEGESERRLFDRWAMAFRPLDSKIVTNLTGYVNPDTESEYGRNLLAPLLTMEALELISYNLRRDQK